MSTGFLLKALGPSGAYGFAFSVFCLRDRKIVDLVEQIRECENIEISRTHEQLLDNLRRHPPSEFRDEALPVAREYWHRMIYHPRWHVFHAG